MAPSESGSNILSIPVVLPAMSPELALLRYQVRMARQTRELLSFSDLTRVCASVPDIAQEAEFQLGRYYSAPNRLEFRPIGFSGDALVRKYVISRLLQAEVNQVGRGRGDRSAISPVNYKFKYKGQSRIDGQSVFVFQIKPRHKRSDLFKGQIYLDVVTGSIRRAEGDFAKSPSFFIKKIHFVQEYEDLGDFTFAVHLHSVANTRLVGPVVVDVMHSDFQINAVEATKDVLRIQKPDFPVVLGCEDTTF